VSEKGNINNNNKKKTAKEQTQCHHIDYHTNCKELKHLHEDRDCQTEQQSKNWLSSVRQRDTKYQDSRGQKMEDETGK
jgi:hypothetical protein